MWTNTKYYLQVFFQHNLLGYLGYKRLWATYAIFFIFNKITVLSKSCVWDMSYQENISRQKNMNITCNPNVFLVDAELQLHYLIFLSIIAL